MTAACSPGSRPSGDATSDPVAFDDLLTGLSPRERVRLQETFAAFPRGVVRALEVGFNDFRVTRALLRVADVVSIDLPRPVIGSPRGASLAFSNIRAVPFADASFDLVVCTEVLEHLDDSTLRAGVAELHRVSRRFVLVTVPCRQRVDNELFKCSRCGHEENCMGHLREIAEADLTAWFPGWQVVALREIGTIEGYAPRWLYVVSRQIGSVWFDYWTDQCPNCGARGSRAADNAIGRLLRRVIWRLVARAAPRAAWLLALFEKRDIGALDRPHLSD